MSDLRPFPPSPRRRAFARGVGLHAASPALVGGVAAAAVSIVLGMAGAAVVDRIGTWLAGATRGAATLTARDTPLAVLELAAPLLAAAAIVAVLAHFAQTRSLWIPRRRIEGAPSIDPARTRRALLDLVSAAVIGVVAFGWLWLVAPRIARLSSMPLAGALLVASAVATFAIAWVVLGVLDALVRYRDLSLALYMTAREKREDARRSSIDPRWRASYRREPVDDLAGATLVLLGDGIAVAIAWDPIHRPIPTRVAVGRDARATQLLGLARRHRIPTHRDVVLARALVGNAGPVAESHWSRLAEIVAAVRR